MNICDSARRLMFGKSTWRIWGILWMLIPVAAAWGQSSGSAGQDGGKTSYFQQFVVAGGWITFGIVLLSCVTIGLIVDHFIHIRRGAMIPDELKMELAELINQKKYQEVVRTTSEHQSLLASLLHAGLMNAGRGKVSMDAAMEEVLENRSASLNRRIEYLNIIGNVSPMIGLFGTVFGMIKAFGTIMAKGGTPDPATLAGDISVALVTTFWGLLVAIPAVSIFHLMRNRIDGLMTAGAREAEELLSIILTMGATRPVSPSE